MLHFHGTVYGRAPQHHRYPRWRSVGSARLARCCTSTARFTVALLGIIANLAGARSALLVSLEAAAALTGRFFDRTLYRHRMCCTSTARFTVALLGIIATLAGARSALLVLQDLPRDLGLILRSKCVRAHGELTCTTEHGARTGWSSAAG